MKNLIALLVLAGACFAQSLPVIVRNFDHQPPAVPSFLWPDGFHPYVIVSVNDKQAGRYSVTLTYMDDLYRTQIVSQLIENDRRDQMPTAIFRVTAMKIVNVTAYPYVDGRYDARKRSFSRLLPLSD